MEGRPVTIARSPWLEPSTLVEQRIIACHRQTVEARQAISIISLLMIEIGSSIGFSDSLAKRRSG